MSDDIDDVRLTLRLPVALRDKLANETATSGRSLNAEMVRRLETSFTRGGEASEWQRRYEEEHQAFQRMDHMFNQQMRLAEDYARHVSRKNREVYNQSGIIESLATIILSIETAPSEEIRAMASSLLDAALAVKRSFPTDYEAIMAKQKAERRGANAEDDGEAIPF